MIRQRPSTAHGMVFATLESERGLINVVVKPAIYERYRQVWRGCRLVVVTGVVERRHGVVNVIAHHVRSISQGYSSLR